MILLTIVTFLTRYDYGHLNILLNAFGVGCLVILNLLIAIFYGLTKNYSLAKLFLFNSGIVLLIGFSSCLIIENNR